MLICIIHVHEQRPSQRTKDGETEPSGDNPLRPFRKKAFYVKEIARILNDNYNGLYLLTETVKTEEKKIIPKLYLMYDLTDEELSKEIYGLLKSYPGESPVIVKCSKRKTPFQLGITVNPKGFLLNELHAFIEDDYIKVI